MLGSILNARDIGGLVAADGRRVASGRLLRSGSVSAVTQDDADYLIATIGLKTVIDLRQPIESGGREHALAPHGVRVVELPLWAYSGARDNALPELSEPNLATVYLTYLERSGAMLGEVVGLLADPANLAALIHCTAGKDRTGVAVAVLLDLLGVSEDQIVADYALSAADMPRVIEFIRSSAKHTGFEIGDELAWLLKAEAATMEDFLARFHEQFGSAREWALANGVSVETIERLADNLLES